MIIGDVEMNKKDDKNKGSLTVEMLVIMIPFMLAFCTIINMARFVNAEMIIHHAITQTAKEISAYSYVMTRTGITDRMQKRNAKSEAFKGEVNSTVQSITDFTKSFGSGSASTIYSSGQAAWDSVGSMASDPGAVVSGILDVARSESRSYIMRTLAGGLARGSIKKQISLMDGDADQYLERLGVVDGLDGLHFDLSKWNNNTGTDVPRGDIKVVVTFEIKNNLFPMFDFGTRECILSASTLTW